MLRHCNMLSSINIIITVIMIIIGGGVAAAAMAVTPSTNRLAVVGIEYFEKRKQASTFSALILIKF